MMVQQFNLKTKKCKHHPKEVKKATENVIIKNSVCLTNIVPRHVVLASLYYEKFDYIYILFIYCRMKSYFENLQATYTLSYKVNIYTHEHIIYLCI